MIKAFDTYINESVSNLKDIRFENGDLNFDMFYKDGHDIYIAKEIEDLGYRATMLRTFLRQSEWYILKDGINDIIYQHNHLEYIMSRCEYKLHYNFWYEGGQIHGVKKENIIKLYPFDGSFDNFTIEHIKPVINIPNSIHVGDRVKVKETSKIGNVIHIGGHDVGLEMHYLGIRLFIERETNLPWWCNPVIVNIDNKAICLHPDNLIILKRKNIISKEDPFGEEDWDE